MAPVADMHFLNSLAHVVVASTTSTTTKASASSGSYFLLVLVALFVVVYFAMIRPNQRRRMQAMRQARSYDLGDEVVAAGMVGRVVRVGDGEVDVEVADGVVVQFVPQAVQLRSAYLASQTRGGFGAARAGMAGGAGGAPGRPNGAGYGSAYSGQGDQLGNGTSTASIGSRARSVRRRPSASDVWPEVGASGVGPSGFEDVDIAGEGGASGAGTSGGEAAPTGEK
ncbi:MAG TPA: preprotein translocase subunit YajC [Acidimicrobiales bacterium]|nr:preprotein translocase subunit YajC [Acidimicrobiales bacterium]